MSNLFKSYIFKEVLLKVVGGGTPSRNIDKYWNGSILWASVKDFEDNKFTLDNTQESITTLGLLNSSSNLVAKGIPVICTRMAVGRIAILAKPIAINQDLKALYPDTSKITCKYLVLLLHFIRPIVETLSIGSTVKGISLKHLLEIKINIPPLPEQEKIVEILDILDDVIAKTEAAIAKLKNIKTGLVHDLLTRGLDDNGEFRDPIKHPEQFKESPLGIIPKDWVIRSLGDACRERGGSIQTGPFGSQLHAHDYKNSGIPIITVEHLGDNEVFHINLPLIGESDYKRLSKYILKIGDLVFSRVGSIDRCAFISKYENGWLFSGRCLRVRSNDGYLSPKFLSYQLNSFSCRRWILNHSVGSTMSCLNTSILSSLPIKVPHFEEQKAIEEKLIISDKNILNQQAYLEKLKLQKKGLMHDLLTGKKRVNHLL